MPAHSVLFSRGGGGSPREFCRKARGWYTSSVGERGSLDALPTSTLGQYRVRGRIGSGGMGDVYDAIHTTLDKRVAIKTLRRRFLEDPIVVARFLREGQLASRMRHPHIVDVTDVGVIDELPCLVMEHLEGETLGQVIRRDGALKPSQLVDILLPIVAAVDFAHEHGVLHRDLKPSNIFLARSWNGEVHPKVLDFGISKLVHEGADAALTTDSSFVGTPHYASPESVRAEKAPDRRSDQYSMGVILYEGTTGVRPFAEKGGSFVTMAMAICAGDYRPLRTVNPELPEAWERVVQRAMALEADHRFPSMRQLGAALLPFASERARVIWSPTFRSDGTERAVLPPPASVGSETQVLRGSGSVNPAGPSGPYPSVTPHHPSHSGQQALNRTGPSSLPAGWAAPVRPYAMPPGHPSASANLVLGGTPAPSASGLPRLGAPHLTGQHPYPGSHDGTPSFGAGIHSSVQPLPAPRKSPAALLALAALVFVGLGVAAAIVVKGSAHKEAAAASSGQPPTSFSVDVQAQPESAMFELDGAALGTGRLSRSFGRDGQQHVLRVSAPGYETLLLQFDENRPPPSLVALRAGTGSTTMAGTAAPSATPPPKAPTVQAPPPFRPGPTPPPTGKKSTDRPRTDNIDPWEQ
ncbi:MAG: hypothetical protein JWP97_2286 [Labilithrix sp.]|nr:hypothetical protein [Labilithrix sp.]